MEEVYSILSKSVKKEVAFLASSKPETFDRRPLTLMMECDPKLISEGKLLKITSSMRPKYIQDGIQIISGNSSLPDPTPKPEKLVRSSRDAFYDPELHHISKKGVVLPPVYNIDNLDQAWLATVNEERVEKKKARVLEWMLEDVIEASEQICLVKMLSEALANGISEESKCDVCRGLDSEEGNEIVFCDKCNVGVHQMCYGVGTIPEGPWFCRRCELGFDLNTACDMCPFIGGAMKPFKDTRYWAHVNCALWIPHLSFVNTDIMEPISGRNSIPQESRIPICDLCRIPHGVTINCCINGCRGKFHVTCAYEEGLVMDVKTIDLHLRFYPFCPKHSTEDFQVKFSRMARRHKVQNFATDTSQSASEYNDSIVDVVQTVPSPDKTVQLRVNSPAARFHENVSVEDVSNLLAKQQSQHPSSRHSTASGSPATCSNNSRSIPSDIIELILAYWRIKRRSNFNEPLVVNPPSHWTSDLGVSNEHNQTDGIIMAMNTVNKQCLQVRQSLNQARKMANMVIQREKKKTDLVQTMRSISNVQLDSVVQDPIGATMDEVISTAHMGSSVYELGANGQQKQFATTGNRRRRVSRKTIPKVLTGNEVVDAIPREELIICEKVVAMIKEGFARKRGRPRVRRVSDHQSPKWYSYQLTDNEDFLRPPPVKRRGQQRKALASVETNGDGADGTVLSTSGDQTETVAADNPVEIVDLTSKIKA
ncbi:hypothetical protein Aperf_G00000076637 [Anoplocephala perfoliata]